MVDGDAWNPGSRSMYARAHVGSTWIWGSVRLNGPPRELWVGLPDRIHGMLRRRTRMGVLLRDGGVAQPVTHPKKVLCSGVLPV